MARPTRFIAISILFLSTMLTAAVAQPTPEMSTEWQKTVTPKIQSRFDKELARRKIKIAGKTRFMARAYLEKTGSIRNLRIDKETVHSDLPKAQLANIENALTASIRSSAPIPYSSVKDSLLPHLGLYVECNSDTGKLDAGLTHPEDCPGP